MTIYTPYDLETKGIKLVVSQSTVEMEGITYAKGQSFSLTSQILAEKMLQSYIDDGYCAFLVSANQMLTLWRSLEPLPKLSPKVAETISNQPEIQDRASSSDTSPNEVSPEKKLMYRGAPVDIKVPDIAQAGEAKPLLYRGAPVQKTEAPLETPTKKRTYRGVEY